MGTQTGANATQKDIKKSHPNEILILNNFKS